MTDQLTAAEWAALARAYGFALTRGEHSAGRMPAVAVRLAAAAWADAALRLGGAGLLRLWDKLAAIQAGVAADLTDDGRLQHIAAHAEETPKPGGDPL